MTKLFELKYDTLLENVPTWRSLEDLSRAQLFPIVLLKLPRTRVSGDINVSPKLSSLAFDEVKNEHHNCEINIETTLSLLVKPALRNSSHQHKSDEVATVEGRIIVSF